MKKVILSIVAVIILAGATVTAFNLGKNSEAAKTPQDEVITGEETDQNGVLLFKVEGYTLKSDSVVLTGKKSGAFLRWTPDEDWVTSDNVPAEFEVPNEAYMQYYKEYVDYGPSEVWYSRVGDYFNNVYEEAPIKASYIYLHMQNGEVVFVQQALDVCY